MLNHGRAYVATRGRQPEKEEPKVITIQIRYDATQGQSSVPVEAFQAGEKDATERCEKYQHEEDENPSVDLGSLPPFVACMEGFV